MKDIRLLSVTFTEPIEANELNNFRAAIAEKVGWERDLFHNHDNREDNNGETSFHYRYPLIQYSLHRHRPRVTFINEAVDEARYFFSQTDWTLEMDSRHYESEIDELRADRARLGTVEEWRHYRLRRWLPLNMGNLERFQASETLREKIAILETVLTGHLLGMAKGLGYHFESHVEVELTDITGKYKLPYRGISAIAYNVDFRVKAELPVYVGLGKGSSLGHGLLLPPNKKQPATSANATANSPTTF